MTLRIRAVATKEVWVLLRQPQLLLLLLVGPTLIMILFALSFKADHEKPSAVVVVKPDSEGAELFNRFRQRFVSHVDFQGRVESVEEADRLIKTGKVDSAIIIPSNPSKSVAKDKRAVIGAHYSSINPIFGLTVPNRARGLLFDVNDAVVREGVSRELDDISEAQKQVAELDRQLQQVSEEVGALTTDEARDTTSDLDSALSNLEGSLALLEKSGPKDAKKDVSPALEQVRSAQKVVNKVREVQKSSKGEAGQQSRLSRLKEQLDDLKKRLSTVPDVSPSILVNPFRLHLENLAPFQPEVAGFYAPGVLAILIQHIAVSLASLAIIRERLSGAYEFFEISPLGPGQLLAGKFLSYLAVVLGVNAAVVAILVTFLNVPLNGSLVWLGLAMLLLTVASLSAGFALSALARSELQAIQFAMLLLIASGFFAGFLFPLSQMGQPAQSVSYFLPATYGISALQDVMIRGEQMSGFDILLLSAISTISLVVARFFMGKKRT